MVVCHDKLFSIFTGLFQLVLAILFGLCTDYAEYAPPSAGDKSNDPRFFYSFFQDVHVMIFIGFGFLMTFLKKYSFGAVGYNMFISALVLQWATLMGGWLHMAFAEKAVASSTILVDIKTMITSDFAAAAVLITYGAVLGKVSRLQLVVIGIFEVIFYYVNENIIVVHVKVTDAGGTMLVHMFGAYFGLAVARALYDEAAATSDKEESVYHSDVFAMIGTIFLWMFWPSFNGGLLGPGPQQHRVLINTYYSLAACCVATFVISPLVDKKNRLDMVHVQNATLAGGVAVGTCADLIIRPWGAVVIGALAGVLSTLGYAYVTPLLTSKFKVHDTCGVNNLHGMPAIFGAIAGAIAAATASLDTYKGELTAIWGARANTTVISANNITTTNVGRSASSQGGYQALAIVVTLIIAIVGGLFTGIIVKFLDAPDESQMYDDSHYWVTPADVAEEPATANDKAEKTLLMSEVTTPVA